MFIVGIGGFIGATLRYSISGYIQRLTESIGFPYGTFGVNILGCILLGVFLGFNESKTAFASETHLLLVVGLLGAFTTFSTFSNETVNLIVDRRIHMALINVGVHIIFGILAILLGRFLVVMAVK